MERVERIYEDYIAVSRYARYLPEKGRRETWKETVARYFRFMKAKYHSKKIPWKELQAAVENREVLPSMRCLMTAGPALERDNVAGYNCAYVAIDDVRAFDEVLYILMCGTGVGFSVERQFISKLPEVAEEFHEVDTVITVPDSKIGWAASFRQVVSLLYSGAIPRWDVSRLRPAGARLKTFGGRASGPEPLESLFKFAVSVFKGAAGRKLTSIECHDLVCQIADAVVCGGVRRSALLSLSNLTDARMRDAKSGSWWATEPQRALANNSVAYTEKPDIGIFMREWLALFDSKSGERGLFNRVASTTHRPARRDAGEADVHFGTNPCGEITLRSAQFCNLTEAVIRPEDTWDELERKVTLATILGTMQAGLTRFRYLRKVWQRNTEEEALLGVSLTGIMDNPLTAGMACSAELRTLRDCAVKVNQKYAKACRVNPATAVTTVKPSGTVSQLAGCASGIHPRYSAYYVRRVRADKKDPICDALIEVEVPYEEDRVQSGHWVFEFPIRAPEASVHRDDMTAVQQLDHWLMFYQNWAEHQVSATIYIREDEWLDVGAWVYKHFDQIAGLSFLPHTDHVYEQAPYEEIDKDEYGKLCEAFPDAVNLMVGEEDDTTSASQELACTGGACEI